MSAAPVAPVTGQDIPGPALARLANMPRVDLTPPEIAERAALRRLQSGCVAALLVSVAAVGGLYYHAHSQLGGARQQLATAQAQQASVQHQVSALAPVAAQYAAVAQAQSLVSQALGGEVRWSTQLRDLSLSIPNNVWLTSMTVTPAVASTATATTGTALNSTGKPTIATITYVGMANQRDDVANWLESLARERGYANPTYATTPEQLLGTQIFVNFTSSVTVTADALSGRYTQNNGG